MEPKVNVFILPPQMFFEDWEINIAEERLEGFAQVIHGNQNVDTILVNQATNYKSNPENNAEAISDTIKRIINNKPDEIFTVSRAWECDEIRIIVDFCKIAGIKIVEFDLDIVVPDGQRKMYEKQDELFNKNVSTENSMSKPVSTL